jgi:hypothetical protein
MEHPKLENTKQIRTDILRYIKIINESAHHVVVLDVYLKNDTL